MNQQRAGSKLVGRTAALVVAFAGVIVTAALSWQSITASRQDENAGLFDELDRERLRLFRERERSSRGRIFIETAINRSGHPFLDSIGRQLTSVLANVVDNSRIAHVVPRDSVKMIESDVAKLGWATPDKRLERAAAFINVMTVVSGSPDTPRVHVAVQRITNGSSRASRDFSNEMRRYEKLPPLPVPGSRPFKGMETVPFKTVVAPRDSMRRMVSEIARELSRAFDDMRFCDINHHDKPQSLPWCWADENKPVVVKGYYKARQERLRLAKGMTP